MKRDRTFLLYYKIKKNTIKNDFTRDLVCWHDHLIQTWEGGKKADKDERWDIYAVNKLLLIVTSIKKKWQKILFFLSLFFHSGCQSEQKNARSSFAFADKKNRDESYIINIKRSNSIIERKLTIVV